LPVRLAPRPVFLAGREPLLAKLDAWLAGGPGQSGPQLVALYGIGAQARPAWRWSMRTGIWPRWGCAGSSLRRIRRYWRRNSGTRRVRVLHSLQMAGDQHEGLAFTRSEVLIL